MNENKTRTDYEITILEGQKISDIFHEVGLPTHIRGERKVTIQIFTDDIEDNDWIDSIIRVVYDELVSWGFLDNDIQHQLNMEIIESEDYKLKIYTE